MMIIIITIIIVVIVIVIAIVINNNNIIILLKWDDMSVMFMWVNTQLLTGVIILLWEMLYGTKDNLASIGWVRITAYSNPYKFVLH